jgi:hypothetical protein
MTKFENESQTGEKSERDRKIFGKIFVHAHKIMAII